MNSTESQIKNESPSEMLNDKSKKIVQDTPITVDEMQGVIKSSIERKHLAQMVSHLSTSSIYSGTHFNLNTIVELETIPACFPNLQEEV